MSGNFDTREVHWKRNNGASRNYAGPGWNFYSSSDNRNVYEIIAPGGELVARQQGRTVFSLTGEVLFTSDKNQWEPLYALVRSYTELN